MADLEKLDLDKLVQHYRIKLETVEDVISFANRNDWGLMQFVDAPIRVSSDSIIHEYLLKFMTPNGNFFKIIFGDNGRIAKIQLMME